MKMTTKAQHILQYFATETVCSKTVYNCKFCRQLYTRFNVTKMCKHLIRGCPKITDAGRKSIIKVLNVNNETGSSIRNPWAVSVSNVNTSDSEYVVGGLLNSSPSKPTQCPTASHFDDSMNKMCQEPIIKIEEENSEYSIDYSVVGPEPEMDNGLSPHSRDESDECRMRSPPQQSELVELAIKSLKNCSSQNYRPPPKEVDEFDVAGQKLAFDLRNLKPAQRIYAEKLIGDVIYHGRREKLDDYSSVNIFNADPRHPQAFHFPIQNNQNSCTSTLDPSQLQ